MESRRPTVEDLLAGSVCGVLKSMGLALIGESTESFCFIII